MLVISNKAWENIIEIIGRESINNFSATLSLSFSVVEFDKFGILACIGVGYRLEGA